MLTPGSSPNSPPGAQKLNCLQRRLTMQSNMSASNRELLDSAIMYLDGAE